MVKILSTSLVLFLSLFFSKFVSAQSVAPTLGRNNVWTGSNTFQGGLYLPALQQCTSPQVMQGFNANFTPICVTPSGGTGSGVPSVNGITSAVNIVGDTTLTIGVVGNAINLHAAGIQAVSCSGTGLSCGTAGQTTSISLAGGAGTGAVATGVNGQLGGYSANGTTIGAATGLYWLNPSLNLSQANAIIASAPSNSTIIIPDGFPQYPLTNTANLQVIDMRKAAKFVNAAKYGIVCDATTLYVTVTAGSNLVNIGSNVVTNGQTVAIAYKSGDGYGFTQQDWEPTIVGYAYPNMTLSGNAPFSFTGWVTIGTDNQPAFTQAFADIGASYPLQLPANCYSYVGSPVLVTGGQSIIGQQMDGSGLFGAPAQDILQNPDSNIGSWGYPGNREEDYSFYLNTYLDASYPHTHWNAAGTSSVVVPAFYRPILNGTANANNQLGNDWVTNGQNGVASTTAGNAVICVPTALGRIPAIGQTIVFPYFTTGVFTTTVLNNSGAGCSTGFSGTTLNAAIPATDTVAQAYWIAGTAFTTNQTAIPTTMTYPFNLVMSLPTSPNPAGGLYNMAGHGRIKIGTVEFDYHGNTNSASTNTGILTLDRGPATTPGYSVGSQPVIAINPCYVNYETPPPVIPNINSSTQVTPIGAVTFPGECVGNAAISMPEADAQVYVQDGPVQAFWKHLAFFPLNGMPQGFNQSAAIYEAGLTPGSENTMDGMICNYMEMCIVQGPASANNWNVSSVGPTFTGNVIKNVTARGCAWCIVISQYEQGEISRIDSYTGYLNPSTGANIGAGTCLTFATTSNEQTGGLVSFVSQMSLSYWNCEPGSGGSGVEIPPFVDIESLYGNVFFQDTFEGGYNIFGGSQNSVQQSTIALPAINYGSQNRFEANLGSNVSLFTNVWGQNNQFFNWGRNSTCNSFQNFGQLQSCGVGFVQSWNGHDIWSSMMGDNVNPTENVLGGMWLQSEWNGLTGPYFDSTEPWWGSHTECYMAASTGSCIASGYNGSSYILIGPHQRIGAGKYIMKGEFKAKSGTPFTFNLMIYAPNASSSCTPNYSLVTGTPTAGSTWTPFQMAVDFTPYTGCNVQMYFNNSSATDSVEVGYLNFVPMTGQFYSPLNTPTEGGSCPVSGSSRLMLVIYGYALPLLDTLLVRVHGREQQFRKGRTCRLIQH